MTGGSDAKYLGESWLFLLYAGIKSQLQRKNWKSQLSLPEELHQVVNKSTT